MEHIIEIVEGFSRPELWAGQLRRAAAFVLLGGLGLALLAGCDFNVTNPGPVADEFLDDEGAHDAIVTGASAMLSESLWKAQLLGSETTMEITRTGRNFAGQGIKTPPNLGVLARDRGLSGSFWSAHQQARWIPEAAVTRFDEILGGESNSYDRTAAALVTAGFGNRILGETVCSAVIDGSAPQDNRVYWERAEASFSRAMEVAQAAGEPQLAMAARAGLAQVLGRGLGRWGDAASHASQIPSDFTYQAQFGDGDVPEFNHMVYITDGDSWRDLTVLNSFAEDYYLNTGDPRVRWEDTGRTDTPDGLRLLRQRKWTELSDNVNLASGREMRLIEAEALLEQGQWEAAMDLINGLRQGLASDHDGSPVPLAEAGSLEEAWTALKFERRVELWLEGRRMGDTRRWIEEGTPGDMEDLSWVMRLCVPISQGEVDNNPNIPQDWVDPANPLFTGSVDR
jgi:starch-binding outer membrane protein, SusD/RagB family